MKKALLIAALSMMSAAPAMASKARRAALGAVGGVTLVGPSGAGNVAATNVASNPGVATLGAQTTATDVQDAFDNPAKMFEVGDLATFEFGANSTAFPATVTSASQKEGGFFRSHGDMKYGVYLGHKAPLMTTLAASLGGTLPEQNPMEIFFGMKGGSLKWAASLVYVDTKNSPGAGTTTARTQNMGVRFGVAADVWNAYAQMGLTGKAELGNAAGDNAKADSAMRLGGDYNLGDMDIYADYQTGSGKSTTSSVDTKLATTAMVLGVESKIKGDAGMFFYGARYLSYVMSWGDNNKGTTTKLPVYFGVEFDATSWLVLRGSFAQSVLMSTEKYETSAANVANAVNRTMADDASAALGAGIKLGKATLDGTLTKGSLGGLGFDNNSDFLGQLSVTYNF